ncbi:MAG: alpha/beta hydrolase [Ginsengibacter sp.]
MIGHSMGGMLATRFTLMYPDMVEKLVLVDPIGLEDYKTFVPYKPLDLLFANEMKATYASYKKYQQGYYPEWKPEYEQYVKAQAESLYKPHFDKTAWANALTYQMIYEQPVVCEFKDITVPTLLIIGQADQRIVVWSFCKEVILIHISSILFQPSQVSLKIALYQALI